MASTQAITQVNGKRGVCAECGGYIFLHGLSGNRPLFACGCGTNFMGKSSYNGCIAWTLDPDNPDYDEKPELRFVTGEGLAWGDWILTRQEIEELVEAYPQYQEEFE